MFFNKDGFRINQPRKIDVQLNKETIYIYIYSGEATVPVMMSVTSPLHCNDTYVYQNA